jgi:MFS family permease
MMTNLDLKQLERRAWTSFFQDGLLDIMMGLALLAVGIPAMLPGIFTSELSQDVAAAVLMALALGSYWAGKRFITVPRTGRAEFSRARKTRQTKAAVIYAISVVVGAIVFLMTMLGLSSTPPAWVQELGVGGFLALGIGGWMLLILGLGSYFTDYTRGYVIAALYALAFSGTVLLHNPIMFIVAGVLAVVMGLVVLVRFLRTQPKPSELELGTRYDGASW